MMAEGITPNEKSNADLELGSEDIREPWCDPCGIEGSHVLAGGFCNTCSDYLCGNCYKYHCKPKPMRHHILVDAKHMPRSRSKECGEKCRKHIHMPLKIFCKSHDDIGCFKCVSEEHKTCGDIRKIQDCAKDIENSKEYRDFKEGLKTLKDSFEVEIGQAEKDVRYIKDMSAKLRTTEAVSILQRVLEIMSNLAIKKDEMVENGIHLKDTVTTRCKQSMLQLYNILNEEGSDDNKFINMKRGQKYMSQARTCFESVQSDNKPFDEHFSLHDIQKCQPLLHNVMTNLDAQLETSMSSNQSNVLRDESQTSKKTTRIDVNSLFEVVIKGSEEQPDCRITGSATLSDGKIVFVDLENECLRVLTPSTGHSFEELFLGYRPFDVTTLQSGDIAVSVPREWTIKVITLANGSVRTNYKLKTTGPCHGITSDNDVLYVAIDQPPKVEVFKTNGVQLKSFAFDANNQPLFVSPWYLAVSPAMNRIYVTDRYNDTLTCLDKDGKVVHVYKSEDMQTPYGVAVDKSGMIYICARRTDTLVCIDEDFRPVKTIENHEWLHKVESVVVWNKQDRLYIGMYEDNSLTVVDVQKY